MLQTFNYNNYVQAIQLKGKQKSWSWTWSYMCLKELIKTNHFNYNQEYHARSFLGICSQNGIFWSSLRLTGC